MTSFVWFGLGVAVKRWDEEGLAEVGGKIELSIKYLECL